MERGVYQHEGRGRQLLRFDGFQYGNMTPTDIDAVIEYRSRIWVLFEAKLAGKAVPDGQRKALERWIADARRAGKHGMALVVEHHVADAKEDILLTDCVVRELYTTESLKWRPPRRVVTAKEATDAYINLYK